MPGPHGYEHDWIYVGGAGLPSKTAMAGRPHAKGGGDKIRAGHKTARSAEHATGHGFEGKPNRTDTVHTPDGPGTATLVTPSKVTVKLDNPGGGKKYRDYGHGDVSVISRNIKTGVLSAKTDADRREIYEHAKRQGNLGQIPANWKPDGSLRS